ncbi:hypothetical protein P153DRAFT_388655 [Dothidotthia symphoricarpi CBS 119687]|uniref:Uncharacterized protein n=1 Tax=Dothidotthia symphoricarpi CBS 119687 TaxID=1392245 RepID=A0A6A6A647_9PLEO|nr:uncharacterized protein P153DRAFT_388655 [Dothidotthia symphoricarpi CBS 119687]KAF2126623.1 hypothetical protein P153DRAFT_388655 [Dothidotthia symphoricarpi CBS 119687]
MRLGAVKADPLASQRTAGSAAGGEHGSVRSGGDLKAGTSNKRKQSTQDGGGRRLLTWSPQKGRRRGPRLSQRARRERKAPSIAIFLVLVGVLVLVHTARVIYIQTAILRPWWCWCWCWPGAGTLHISGFPTEPASSPAHLGVLTATSGQQLALGSDTTAARYHAFSRFLAPDRPAFAM